MLVQATMKLGFVSGRKDGKKNRKRAAAAI